MKVKTWNSKPCSNYRPTWYTICDVLGDWVYGLREGKGHETSWNGTHDGEWKANNKHGSGAEKSLLGTVYEGRWVNNQKSSHGMRKMVTGDQEEQVSMSMQYLAIIVNVHAKKTL